MCYFVHSLMPQSMLLRAHMYVMTPPREGGLSEWNDCHIIMNDVSQNQRRKSVHIIPYCSLWYYIKYSYTYVYVVRFTLLLIHIYVLPNEWNIICLDWREGY
jgi:hypothetical protein